MPNSISYNSKRFEEYRQELLDFVRTNYPNTINDFSEASIGTMLIELQSAIADNLSYNLDRTFQETQIDFAQERSSLFNIARTYGLKIPNKSASVTLLDISYTVPVSGDSYDKRYAPLVRRGSEFTGGGSTFILQEDSDFNSPFNSAGGTNRTVIPNVNASGIIENYTITKREIIKSGSLKRTTIPINQNASVPFYEYFLPGTDVLKVNRVIELNGLTTRIPTNEEFNNEDSIWYEVPSLIEDKVFTNVKTTEFGESIGSWKTANKRFITEYTDNGFCKLIFGGGIADNSSIESIIDNPSTFSVLNSLTTNISLGMKPRTNTSLYIEYIVGGGESSNTSANTIKGINTIIADVEGGNTSLSDAVLNSIEVNNPVPAFGGRDALSDEEIRNLIRYNFASQNRCVTVKDYFAKVKTMPGEFGRPFRVNVFEEQNKIIIAILNLNSDGSLRNESNSALKSNISEYISEFRMINDYVEVQDGRVYNIGLELDLFISKDSNSTQVTTDVINTIVNYFDINNLEIGENIYISDLYEKINNVNSVLNINDLRIYNKVGGSYSDNEIPQRYIDDTTRQIDLSSDNILFNSPNGMFEIKKPNIDIKVRTKK